MTVTRSGARLHTETRVIRRGIAQMTAADYKQPKCGYCGKPISDDRLDRVGPDSAFCRTRCAKYFGAERRGVRKMSRGRSARYRDVYDKARAASGEFVAITCASADEARALAMSIGQRRDFQAVRNGVSVSVRLVVA